MLIVTGGTGQLGRRIVDHLRTLVSADRIGISTRDPAQAADLARAGIRVRRGDYDDPASLRHAWEGAERVLLVSSNTAARGGDPLAQHRMAIDVARELGVERLLYTSQISASPNSQFPPGRDHAATEAMLAKSGLPWTALRHGFYAASALGMNARGFAQGTLSGPEDGKVAWTTHDDLAEVDARLLAGEETIDGPTPPLTGAEALDLADLARLASDVTGRDIAREVIPEEEMARRARQNGVPGGAIAIMTGYFRAARAGEFDRPDPTLARLLGRDPVPMRDVLAGAPI
ncbi:SDR family oxidoreductase [Mesobaculum littorinae]|uniref:SDR family oxidoreductase n=1 Tax=Mesobaculum littorinae TaxID=2486419 RepID=A0A438AH55_9RHOB|nr:SDR family oxidoreductase [Mesobaculum littorinae]RVV97917.1 SDR family oxidoreductase [Mesobaculum littorinae]